MASASAYAGVVDPYAVLGVDRDASTTQIRRAYVHLARRTHPDVRGDDVTADEEMRQINAAWEVLSDPDARAALDRRLANGPRSGAPGASETPSTAWTPPNGSPGQRATSSEWRDFDLSDSDIDVGFDGDDRAISGAELPVWMRLGAPAAFMAGVFAVIFGVLTGAFFLVRLGLMSLGFAALLFVLSPFVALLRSRRERGSQ